MQTGKYDRILKLIRHYLQTNLTASEKQELRDWRNVTPENDKKFRYLMSEEHFQEGVRRCVKFPEEEIKEWKKILARTKRSRRVLFPALGKYAALFILLVSIGGVLYWQQGREHKLSPACIEKSLKPVLVLANGCEIILENHAEKQPLNPDVYTLGDTLRYRNKTEAENDPEEFHLLKIPRGGEYILELADGTKVYLNAGSQLTYPVSFTNSERRVKLEGEAYFEVTPDQGKPFLVETSHNVVEVLGTSFGVRAYADEDRILTTLIQGKVKVTADNRAAILSPGEQAVYDCNEKRMAVAAVDTDLYVGWKDGRLIFDNQTLKTILKELERWYLFEVVYENKEAAAIPFSINIKKSEHISQVLELIERTTKVKFEIEGNKIIVR